MAPKPRPVMERFMAKVVAQPDGCWSWLGSRNSSGYGHFWRGKTTAAGHHCPEVAHRVAYELLVGPVPEGLQLDHLCRNRLCVNPAHLEPVTNRENALRGVGICAINAAKTHCKHGHEFNHENTRHLPNGGRLCLPCRRAFDRKRRAA